MKFQPAIKWSGSKRSQSEEIVRRISNKEYNTYYEPFCGGCSVLFQLLHSNKQFKRYICSDKNEGLIDLWNHIKTKPQEVIDNYEMMWNELNKDDNIDRKRKYYCDVRARYNESKSPFDFMFIMRTTTNGMPRYNNNGEFNNSFHITRDGIMPEKLAKVIYDWNTAINIKDVQFVHQDYTDVHSNSNDFIYLDPPYANTKGMYYGVFIAN